MNIKLNIEDYLNYEEIREECKAAIRSCIFNQFNKESDLDRLISNLSYRFIFDAIQESTGEDCIQSIKDKVKELSGKTSTILYELFKKADAWDKSESVGIKILNEAIKENESLIKDKVKEAIQDYDFLARKELQDRLEELFREMLEEKLFHTSEKEEK